MPVRTMRSRRCRHWRRPGVAKWFAAPGLEADDHGPPWMKVLLIGLDATDAGAVQAELAASGHTCHTWMPPAPASRDAPEAPAAPGGADVVLVDADCLRAAQGWLARLCAMAPEMPVWAVLARYDVLAVQQSLAAGASDAVLRPLRGGELLMRLHVLAWRMDRRRGAPVALGRLRIDLHARRAWRAGVAVELTAAEWRLLGLVLSRRGRLVTRADLEAALGDDHAALTSNRIEVHVSNLRRKLGPELIETQRGLGYRLGPLK
jgi:two-component system, OmpR family, response regulator